MNSFNNSFDFFKNKQYLFHSLVYSERVIRLRIGTARVIKIYISGYRVKTTSRFMSLSSRPVPVIAHSQSLASSGTQTPRKRSVCDGQDRQTFYRYLQFKID